MSIGHVLTQIVNEANYEKKLAIDKLQVEESGREVASLQGHVAGYRELIGNLSAQFHLVETFIEACLDEPLKIPDVDDALLEIFKAEADEIRGTDEWKAVLARVDENIQHLKDKLLYAAEKTRDLDICQGKYRGQIVYTRVFEAIENEIRRRESKNAEAAEAPDLPFEDVTPPLRPFVPIEAPIDVEAELVDGESPEMDDDEEDDEAPAVADRIDDFSAASTSEAR